MARRASDDHIEAIFADTGADPAELRRLRSRIDQVHDDVPQHEEPDFLAEATSKAFELVHILVDEGLLKTRHLGADGADRARLLAIVEANVAYLRATLNALSP
ncbi:MAG: hypothetical protein H0T54_02870 [Geodermatophilaceae bacterium]|nr:hypothetical protein [Geodermatophilaceae bacterium]